MGELDCLSGLSYQTGMSIFDPVSPEVMRECEESAAVRSVQASLYQRLRKHWPAPTQRGRIGWALIRLTQPEHAGHASARADIGALPSAKLADLGEIVKAVAKSEKAAPAWAALTSAIQHEIAGMLRAAAKPAVALVAAEPRESREARARAEYEELLRSGTAKVRRGE